MNIKLLLIALILFCCKDNTSKDQRSDLADQKTGLAKKINTNSNGDLIAYPPCNEEEIPHYTAHKISSAPKIDGKLDEEFWEAVPKSTRFKDLISGTETIHDTRVAVVWDEEFLYIAYWIEEPSTKYFLFGKNPTKVGDMIKYQNLVLIKKEEGAFTVWVINHIRKGHVSVIGTGTSPD